MLRKIGLIILLTPLTYNLCFSQKDSIKINELSVLVDSLKGEIVKMQSDMIELKISKNYFDIIVSSQWNIFSTIIAGIFLILTIINFKAIFRDLPNLIRAQQKTEVDLIKVQDSLEEIRFNSNRAFFLGHLNRNNYEWATIIALRCVELSVKNKDTNGVLNWIKQASETYDNVTDPQKKSFKESFLKEANRRLDLALGIPDIDDPTYRQKISELKSKLNS